MTLVFRLPCFDGPAAVEIHFARVSIARALDGTNLNRAAADAQGDRAGRLLVQVAVFVQRRSALSRAQVLQTLEVVMPVAFGMIDAQRGDRGEILVQRDHAGVGQVLAR